MSFNQPPKISSGPHCRTARINRRVFCDEKPPLHSSFYQALRNFRPCIHPEPPKLLHGQIGNQRFSRCYWAFVNWRPTTKSRIASLQGDLKVLEMHGNVILKFLDQRIRTTGGPKLGCIEHDARTIQSYRRRSNSQRIEAGQPIASRLRFAPVSAPRCATVDIRGESRRREICGRELPGGRAFAFIHQKN
jgi:hypothetical protein